MHVVTRPAAIAQFGSFLQLENSWMPPWLRLGVAPPASLAYLKGLTEDIQSIRSEIAAGSVLEFHEKLGGSFIKTDGFFFELLRQNPDISSEEASDIIKSYCIRAVKDAWDKISNLAPRGFFSVLERRKLQSLRECHETGTLFDGLKVEIKRLPDEFTLPSPVLPLGSKVYHLVDSISYGGTVTISEYVVQSNYISLIRDVPEDILKAHMPYRVSLRFLSPSWNNAASL